ncbi:hypothetical protein C2S53_011872 [Perilla frutescens var. hirtella]|uniref:MULE transposase domain-containing protein n=1 Tax=Perilla frutescens var. hirtella TaxID=608512 RepID=A0AAD4NW93_PERFH|nr:hypothetical protein C2S53_011872 [Perilla frutescens var. hirtella]
MHEQPIAMFGKSRDELEESVAEKEQNAIVVVNEVDIVILEKSGDEHEEFVDENEHNITLPEKGSRGRAYGWPYDKRSPEFVNRMKMKQIEVGDAQSFVDMLCQDGAEDEGFFYRFKLDSDGRLSNVFWRDSMMCEDYHLYGDVLVFDTTYRTNKYNMICAPFVGLNNHKKNVMFGFSKCPVTIFTDQDLAITNALSKVFPDARHRLCIWHLYQNAVSRFGRLKGNKAFNDAFQRCLTGCVNKEEFERCWASMVYTLSVFTDFEDELLKSISSTVNVLGGELEVRVYDVQNYDAGTAHRLENIGQEFRTITFNSWRHKMARQYYSVLIKAQESEDARMIIEEGSKKIFEAVEELNVTETLILDTDVSSSCISVLDPPKTTTNGRKKRIKGQLEKGRKKKTSDTANSIELDEFGSKTPNPRLF